MKTIHAYTYLLCIVSPSCDTLDYQNVDSLHSTMFEYVYSPPSYFADVFCTMTFERSIMPRPSYLKQSNTK